MKINQVLVESAGATVAFAFGRFNPAHQGHIEVWRAVEQAGANWFIGTNPSTLGPNDPLTFEQKSAWMEEIYPPIRGHIVAEQSVLTLAAYIFKKLRKNERATVAYITDATDWAWSGKLLNQYNGVEGSHGYYKFAQIIHEPSPRVSSATALRDAARANDKVAFYHASGTDPKSKVAGLTYFDTVKQACEKYPLPVKRAKKVKEEQNVAEGLSQTLRKVVPGYAKREIDRKMDAEKFGRRDVDKDANFQRYKKIQDKLKEQDVNEVSTELRNRYVTSASDDYSNANFAARASKSHPGLDDYSKEQEQRAKRRAAGLNRALSDKRLGRENNLNEFAPGAGDDGGGEDPYKYPKPEQYRRSADFFGKFEADHFDREDFDDATGVFKGYWGKDQIAYFKFDNPAETSSDDSGMGWYYEPESSASNDTISVKPAAFDNSEQRKQQELGMINAFLKSGQTPKPGSQIHSLMKRHGLVENEQKTQAKTWDQMTSQEKLSGVKGRTVWNEKTKKYYTVFDVPAKEVDEASLATMRDFFAGDENARDPYEITKQRLHFSKDANQSQPTQQKEFRSKWEYDQWLAQNKLKPISHPKGWTLINKNKA